MRREARERGNETGNEKVQVRKRERMKEREKVNEACNRILVHIIARNDSWQFKRLKLNKCIYIVSHNGQSAAA